MYHHIYRYQDCNKIWKIIIWPVSHTIKPSDPLVLAHDILCCGMYPAGKAAIFQHLATPVQCDYTVSKLSADAGLLCSEV